jgi:hypothetical protein
MKTTRIDLHNHTTRCNHAEGTIDEYIERAIEIGIDITVSLNMPLWILIQNTDYRYVT